MSKYIRAAISDLSDEPNYIKEGLASDPNTPESTLELLAKDPNENIRRLVACNPSITLSVIQILLQDDSADWVRGDVAENPSTPIDILNTLANDSSIYVQSHVARNPNATESILRTLSESHNGGVRVEVAENPSTPWDVLVKLGQDEIFAVRRATYVDYRVEVGFAGIIGASEFIEMQARPEVTKEELQDMLSEDYDSDLMDLLDDSETNYIEDDEWEITLNFNGYIGCDETYTVYADDEESAVYAALEEAVYDFLVIDFECLGRR